MSSEGCSAPLHVDIEVDRDNYEEGFRHILSIIRPGWNSDDIKFKRVKEGLLNLLVTCYITEKPDYSAILLKVHGLQFTDLKDSKRETAAVKLAGELGFGPTLCCSFKNGYGMEFIPGTTYGWDEDSLNTFREVEMGRVVAKLLARLHCKETLEKCRECNIGKGIELVADGREELMKNWSNPIKSKELTDFFYEGLPSKEELLIEVDRVAAIRDEMNVEERMIHGDPNHTNVIFNKESGKSVIVDYEFAGLGNPLQDLAMHLNLAAQGNTRADGDKHRSPDHEKMFVRTYLTELRRLDGEKPPTEGEFERLYVMVQKYYIIFSLVICLFMPSFLRGTERVENAKEFMSCFRGRIKYYLKHKDRVFSMSTPDVLLA